MTYNNFKPNQKVNRRAIAWALFSQSIWLPAILIDTQDQLAFKNSDYDFSGVAAYIPGQNVSALPSVASNKFNSSSSIIAQQFHQTPQTNGVVLNTLLPQDSKIESKISHINSPAAASTPLAFSTSIRQPSIPVALNFNQTTPVSRVNSLSPRTREFPPTDLLSRLYSRSDLLGGTLTLGDLNEPLMPPIARAERAQSNRSGDPLSALPQMWKEPMRKALRNLSGDLISGSPSVSGKAPSPLTIETARVIHVPSSRVKRSSEVPLALQSDGTVDILNSPDDPEAVEEIKAWSSKQKLPAKGKMAPAVVHLHPLPQEDQAPVSKRITPASSQLPPVEPVGHTPERVTPALQEASVPVTVKQSAPPTPPPPISEPQTSQHKPLASQTAIAEVNTPISPSSISGEVQ